MAASAGVGAKRKIGGHFGSAVGASTKKPRGDWRDELDEPEEKQAAASSNTAPPRVLAGEDSGSEEMLDPGTPLPSDSEEEISTNAASVAAGSAASAAAGREGETTEAIEEAPVPQAAAVADVDQTSHLPQTKRSCVKVALEFVVGETPSASLQILLRNGLDSDIETRLAACVPPVGASVDAIAAGAVCVFGGHPALKLKRDAGTGNAGDGGGSDNEGAEVAQVPAGGSCDSGSATAACSSSTSPAIVHHGCAGLLSAPREGPGLALTLGPQPQLDATHRVLGPAIIGRSAVRRIEAMAPLTGDSAPRQPLAIRAVARERQNGIVNGIAKDGAATGDDGAANGSCKEAERISGESAILQHEFLVLEPAADSVEEQPFSLEGSGKAPVLELLDVIELELNGRDTEIQELKAMPFNRERAEGVAAIEEALTSVQGRLSGFSDLDEALSHQRCWQQERASHLKRILQKLR